MRARETEGSEREAGRNQSYYVIVFFFINAGVFNAGVFVCMHLCTFLYVCI